MLNKPSSWYTGMSHASVPAPLVRGSHDDLPLVTAGKRRREDDENSLVLTESEDELDAGPTTFSHAVSATVQQYASLSVDPFQQLSAADVDTLLEGAVSGAASPLRSGDISTGDVTDSSFVYNAHPAPGSRTTASTYAYLLSPGRTHAAPAPVASAAAAAAATMAAVPLYGESSAFATPAAGVPEPPPRVPTLKPRAIVPRKRRMSAAAVGDPYAEDADARPAQVGDLLQSRIVLGVGGMYRRSTRDAAASLGVHFARVLYDCVQPFVEMDVRLRTDSGLRWEHVEAHVDVEYYDVVGHAWLPMPSEFGTRGFKAFTTTRDTVTSAFLCTPSGGHEHIEMYVVLKGQSSLKDELKGQKQALLHRLRVRLMCGDVVVCMTPMSEPFMRRGHSSGNSAGLYSSPTAPPDARPDLTPNQVSTMLSLGAGREPGTRKNNKIRAHWLSWLEANPMPPPARH